MRNESAVAVDDHVNESLTGDDDHGRAVTPTGQPERRGVDDGKGHMGKTES